MKNGAENVIVSSNMLKALMSQVLQVDNNNGLKLKLILSNEKDTTIENSKEGVSEPGASSVLEARSCGKQLQPGWVMLPMKFGMVTPLYYV